MAKIKTIPFQGGVITAREQVLIPHGGFSALQNFRGTHPGFEQRKGQVKHHTTADASIETMTLFQLSKGRRAERRLFRQLVDGSVQEATDNPPTITTGVFGSDVLSAVSSAVPASWSILNDNLLFSDNIRQHQVYAGDSQPVKAFVVYKGAATIPVIPEIGEDYTVEVTDGQSGTVAILDSLSTLAAFDAIYILTPIPVNDITFTVTAVNGTASVLQVKYWKGAWTGVSGISDGTSSGGASMAQSGAVTWTAPTDEIPHYQFGRSGYWYQLSLSSGAMDAEVEVSEVVYDGNWMSLINVWDGVLVPAIEAQIYTDGRTGYTVYGGTAITLDRLGTSDYCYFNTLDSISGFYADTGANPNIIKATVTGSSSISFNDNGASQDTIVTSDGNFLSAGFEPGQSITVTGTVSNNITTNIINVTFSTIWVKTGALTAEADKSATITFGANTTDLDSVEVWTGSAWTSVTSLDDGTNGLIKSGFVTWDRTGVTPQPTQFNESQYYAYWYRFSLDKELSNAVTIAIETMPYFDISKLGFGKSNVVWKERACFTFDIYPQYVYISAKDSFTSLNGLDYGILEAGDGRSNAVRCMKKFYNELLVWQEERGEDGGCTTLFEGYSPTTFGKLVLSSKVGIMNAKCATVVDGVLTSTETEEKIKTMAFWLSKYGVMATDGRTISIISDDIQNYFDFTKSECIRRGYEDKMWLEYDSAYNVLRIGLVSGSSATTPNIFPVYDLVDGTWSFDILGQALSCLAEVEAASGDTPVLQVAGGSTDGFVYQCNTTDDDVSTAIDSKVDLELDGGGGYILLDEAVLRMKAQSSGNITTTIAKNGNSSFATDQTLSMIAETTNDSYRRHRWRPHIKSNRLSLRIRNNVSGEAVSLADLGLDITLIEQKR